MKSELESKVSELEGKCSEMSQQLSLLSNDLQSAEDENVTLHEKINHLEKNVQMKGELKRELLFLWFLHTCILSFNTLQNLFILTAILPYLYAQTHMWVKCKLICFIVESNSELEENVSKMEEKCSKMSQQLSLLSNDLQAAEDENVILLEKINQVQKQNEENGELV